MKENKFANSNYEGGYFINKKTKAFTLIELLAIIVILAIIAVITVPIILNIIENSRKGAAVDSAYGYKDSVNKTYITELSKPNQGSLKLDGIYEVQNDGTLKPASGYTFGVTNYNTLPVSVSGDKPSSGTLTYENNVLKNGYLVIGDYRVEFKSDGTVTTTKNNSSSSTQQSGENEQNNNGPTAADITTSDYGTYVDLGTSLLDLENITLADNTHPAADWRVFYKDAGGVWLILADYLPVGEGTTGDSVVSTLGLDTDSGSYQYSVWSNDSREDLIDKLAGDWSGLITGSDVAEISGVQVKGAVDLPTWVNSWNAKYISDILYTAQTESAMDDGLNGYYIGYSEDPDLTQIDLLSQTGYNDTLYFPHHVEVDIVSGYLLSSPSAEDAQTVMSTDYSGFVSRGDYFQDYHGVRAVVYLPNSIALDTTETVWTIAE